GRAATVLIEGTVMRLLGALALLVAIAGLVSVARADDKPNPTGTWKWTLEPQGGKGKAREVTLKLKLDGEKLTGAMVGRQNDNPIEDAKFGKDGEVSFSVTIDRNGNKVTRKYSGKISGDTFKGKMEYERNGESVSREFEAKRVKD